MADQIDILNKFSESNKLNLQSVAGTINRLVEPLFPAFIHDIAKTRNQLDLLDFSAVPAIRFFDAVFDYNERRLKMNKSLYVFRPSMIFGVLEYGGIPSKRYLTVYLLEKYKAIEKRLRLRALGIKNVANPLLIYLKVKWWLNGRKSTQMEERIKTIRTIVEAGCINQAHTELLLINSELKDKELAKWLQKARVHIEYKALMKTLKAKYLLTN